MDSKKRFLLRGKTIREYAKPAEQTPAATPDVPVRFQSIDGIGGVPLGEVQMFSGSRPAPREIVEFDMPLLRRDGIHRSHAMAALGSAFGIDPTGNSLAADIIREFGPGQRRGFPRLRFLENEPSPSVAFDMTQQLSETYTTLDRPIAHDPEVISRLPVNALRNLYGLPESSYEAAYEQQDRLAGWRISHYPELSSFQEFMLREGKAANLFAEASEFNWRERISQASNPIHFGVFACVAYACGTDTVNYRSHTHEQLMRLLMSSPSMSPATLSYNDTLRVLQEYMNNLRVRGYAGTVRCGR